MLDMVVRLARSGEAELSTTLLQMRRPARVAPTRGGSFATHRDVPDVRRRPYGKAEDALELYVSAFEDARLVDVERFGADEHERDLKHATLAAEPRERGPNSLAWLAREKHARQDSNL